MIRSTISMLTVFVLLTNCLPAAAQDGFGERLLRRVGLGSAGRTEKSFDGILKAFRGVAKKPAQSTVRVLGDGERVAFGAVVEPQYVLTKASQVQGKKKVEIRLSGGKSHAAKIVGIHRGTDLALIQLTGKVKLKPIAWATADAEVGSFLVTTGLSSVPVCIGVASVKPRKIAPRRGLLGVILRESVDGEDGPAIRQILPNSAAAKAKMKVDDVILKVNGKKVERVADLQQSIQAYRPGHRVHLQVERDGKQIKTIVELGDFDQISSPNHFQNGLGGPRSKRRGGFDTALQHDSFLKPTDCGGPVVNLQGKAVGINIARASRIASYAIPVSAIKPLIPQLKSGKFPVSETEAQQRSDLVTELVKLEKREMRWKARRSAQKAFVKKRQVRLSKVEKAKKPDKKKIAQAKKDLAAAKKDLAKYETDLKKLTNRIGEIRKKISGKK